MQRPSSATLRPSGGMSSPVLRFEALPSHHEGSRAASPTSFFVDVHSNARVHSSTPIHWYTGILAHRYPGTPIHGYTKTSAQRYTGTQRHWYTNALVHKSLEEDRIESCKIQKERFRAIRSFCPGAIRSILYSTFVLSDTEHAILPRQNDALWARRSDLRCFSEAFSDGTHTIRLRQKVIVNDGTTKTNTSSRNPFKQINDTGTSHAHILRSHGNHELYP